MVAVVDVVVQMVGCSSVSYHIHKSPNKVDEVVDVDLLERKEKMVEGGLLMVEVNSLLRLEEIEQETQCLMDKLYCYRYCRQDLDSFEDVENLWSVVVEDIVADVVDNHDYIEYFVDLKQDMGCCLQIVVNIDFEEMVKNDDFDFEVES